MAFGNYTIAGTATQIVAANTGTPRRIALMIRNRSATDTLFLGDANTVTASNGYPLEAGEELILDLDDRDWETRLGVPVLAATICVAVQQL